MRTRVHQERRGTDEGIDMARSVTDAKHLSIADRRFLAFLEHSPSEQTPFISIIRVDRQCFISLEREATVNKFPEEAKIKTYCSV